MYINNRMHGTFGRAKTGRMVIVLVNQVVQIERENHLHAKPEYNEERQGLAANCAYKIHGRQSFYFVDLNYHYSLFLFLPPFSPV